MQADIKHLIRCNEALRRSIWQISQGSNLDSSLELLLLEAMRCARASGGAITLWKNGKYDGQACVAESGAISPPSDWSQETIFSEAPNFFDSHGEGFTQQLLRCGFSRESLEWQRQFWPAAADYHSKRGHSEVWDVPCVRDGQLLSQLTLAFRIGPEPDPLLIETLEALAQQITVALDINRIAREQQGTARGQELAGSNAALTRPIVQEKAQISWEIHDALAQGYVAIVLQMEALEASLAQKLEAPVSRCIQTVKRLARDNLVQARKTIVELQEAQFEQT